MEAPLNVALDVPLQTKSSADAVSKRAFSLDNLKIAFSNCTSILQKFLQSGA